MMMTKRPERMGEYLNNGPPDWDRVIDALPGEEDIVIDVGYATLQCSRDCTDEYHTVTRDGCWPLPNVWIGISIEDQATADERIPHLLRCPAAVQFLSCKPLLEAVDLRPYLFLDENVKKCPRCSYFTNHTLERTCPNDNVRLGRDTRLDWVIAGGESGPGARPCDIEWIRSIVEQCKAAGVPVFVKQLGSRPMQSSACHPSMVLAAPKSRGWPCHDRKGGDPEEWPEDLRVREMPMGVQHG